jgi:hypothetical protein
MFTSAPTRVAGALAALAALLLASPAVSAETTYRWIDPNTGGTVISDLPPPPGARQVTKYTTTIGGGERQPLPYAVRQASEKFPVVLYTSAGCGDPCKQARALLNGRGVPFSPRKCSTARRNLPNSAGNSAGKPSYPASASAGKALGASNPRNGTISLTRPPIRPLLPIAPGPRKSVLSDFLP